MAINPDNITTIRVDQLATATLSVGNEFAHSQGSELKKATIQDLVDIVSTAVGAGSGVGFLPISVTDGQQLPSVPADPSFFLCGAGTYLNVNGFPDVVCTDELNAVMSLSDHWQLSVGIPITPDLQSIGISQSVNSGTIDKAPSENAVYNFVYNYVASQILKSSLGYFDYNDLATQTTPISVPSNTQTLLTNDTLGANTDETQPPFGVTAVWNGGTSNFFDFQQLSIGDTVDIRIHLKTTTSANNQLYHIDMKAGIGSASEFENRIFSAYVKTSAVDEQTFVTTFYVGNADIRDYPAQLFITSVGNTATVDVVGWFVRVFRKSVNIVDIVVAEEAPIDGLVYGRKDAAWFEVTGGGGGIPDAPNDANAYVRSALAWVIGYTKTAIDTLLGNKVDKITPIVGATKTKVTYNTQGQVTSGADATTDDIPDSVNKRYQTDAQETVNDATSSIQTQLNGKVNNTGAETIAGAKTFSSNLIMPATGTPRILQVESGGTISGLDTGTYPSLTELATVKGVTSAIQGQINLKQPYAVARTTTAITFDVPAIYNSFTTPQTGVLTSDLTGARIGVVQVIYLNVATFPTLSGWVNIGSRAFQASVVNIIYAKWSESSRVEYWISKATA